MSIQTIVVYGPGGYDTTKPDNNVVGTYTVNIPIEKDNEEAVKSGLTTDAAVAITQLRAYIALSSPTNAQTAAAVKLLARAMLRLLRLVLGRYDEAD